MSRGRRTIGLENLGDQLDADPQPEPKPARPNRHPRVAPEWKFKTSPNMTATPGRETNTLPLPPGACTYPAGCAEPAVDGRWYCRQHVAALERRAAELVHNAKKGHR